MGSLRPPTLVAAGVQPCSITAARSSVRVRGYWGESMTSNFKKLLICGLAVLPVVLFGRSAGPPQARTGAEVDGGINCTRCHAGTANDARGRLAITAAPYSPGVKQKITVQLEHPDARRWGFQLTARQESNPSQMAGTFTASDEIRVRCGMDETQPDSPCNGAVEFASHRQVSTNAGQGGGRTWEVEWTPPATSVGPVIFYLAGNAANNSNSPAGDFIYTTSSTISSNDPGPTVKPAISSGGVAEAFNFTTANGIASHSWVVIVGTNLAASTRTWDDAIVGQALPTSLAGASVKINNKAAAIYYASPTQLNVLAPQDDATGDVSVVVTTAAGESTPFTVRKAAAAPAFFAPFAQGDRFYVTAVALDGALIGNKAVDTRVARAARPGETILLFGSGFGATAPAVAADIVVQGSPALVTKPAIRLGETVATFAGNGNLVAAGLYQFNLTIPATLAAGDYAIVAEIGGIRSASTVFLTVAP